MDRHHYLRSLTMAASGILNHYYIMPRILTGIQCTGITHLGNILGAMLPILELSTNPKYEAFIFLADLHTLTTIKDPRLCKSYVHVAASAWLALGLDPEKATFYRQSRIPAVCELAWYLSCFTPYPMLANAHAFKDKSDRVATVNAGLFTYPVLMSADILLYQADGVPVGKDQLQHLEITRDIASSFNNQYGPTFQVPQAIIDKTIATVPGVDGQKMSKSYHNTINIFASEKELRKTIMQIQTDSKSVEEPKDPDQCIIFKLYSLLADSTDTSTMRQRYLAGGYGYGQAKEDLFSLILYKFSTARERFSMYDQDPIAIENILAIGEKKAAEEANKTLFLVRKKLGYE
jgi:tryptophanyl-tRNA synthetase